tara:strand:- start:5412 stop:5915 length:504 start_codon:yes stop_codon:yes gene_type:complete
VRGFYASSWSIDRRAFGGTARPHTSLLYEEVAEEAQRCLSFALVRDPIERFIDASAVYGHCKSQYDLVRFVEDHEDPPETEDRSFHPQHLFVGPHTKIFKYEEDFDTLIRALSACGMIDPDYDPSIIPIPRCNFEVDRAEISSSLGKVRRWYLQDYKQFKYIPNKKS